MTIKNRLAKLESKATEAQRGTWKDFITGAWQPDPAAWAAFLAEQKPSEILARADELIAAGAQPTAAQRAAIESIRQATHEHK
jgi:hypothetical protein